MFAPLRSGMLYPTVLELGKDGQVKLYHPTHTVVNYGSELTSCSSTAGTAVVSQLRATHKKSALFYRGSLTTCLRILLIMTI